MLHVTCDLCGKEIRPKEEPQYVVKIEVYAAHDPHALTDADLDDDHLEEVSALLQAAEDGDTDLEEAPERQRLRYDLCATCRQKFVKDPLSREADMHLDFSEN